ncbi:cell division control protein [Moniliophthora roreri MCA 2997]|nr:cell division control protein [Moniliophthora roreri MCA 2997]
MNFLRNPAPKRAEEPLPPALLSSLSPPMPVHIDGVFVDVEPIFCRVLYDYEDPYDPSQLRIRKGDVIKLLSQSRSFYGWWRGLLGEEYGWFPSSYVTIISEEAELVFSAEMRLDNVEEREWL